MAIWIAHHCKVTHDTTNIHRRLNQNILSSRELGNSIHFFPTVALKTEMIQAGLHFILHDDQNEDRIFSLVCCRTEPDIVTPLEPSITHD